MATNFQNFQMIALSLLCRVIMLESGNSITMNKAQNEYSSYFVFPFLFFGMMAAGKEMRKTQRDINFFKRYYRVWYGENQALPAQFVLLKMAAEMILGYLGSLIYFGVLTIYSEIGDWSDVLDVILNLLAFGFILEADEWAYEYFAQDRIQALMSKITVIRTGNTESMIDLFDMGQMSFVWKFDGTTIIYLNSLATFIFCIIFQALLSNNGILLLITFLCMAIISVWLVVTRRIDIDRMLGNTMLMK